MMTTPRGSADSNPIPDNDRLAADRAVSPRTTSGSGDDATRGDGALGAAKAFTATNLPARGNVPQREVIVRQLNPDTNVPAHGNATNPEVVVRQLNPDTNVPAPTPHAGPAIAPPFSQQSALPHEVQGRPRGVQAASRRRIYVGVMAIVIMLLVLGFFIVWMFWHVTGAAPTSVNAPLPGGALTASPVLTAVPTNVAAPTAIPAIIPAPTAVPTDIPAPTAVATATVAATAIPPTSVPTAPPPTPTVAPTAPPTPVVIPRAAPQLPAAPVQPPGIQPPLPTFPSASQVPRRLPNP